MANIKLDGHTWDTSGVYDAEQAKTQKEINADVSDLKSALTDVTDIAYNAYITDTATGAIASFDDGADGLPVKSLVVNVDPVQDLHGYDNPWPAGGGENVLDPNIKFTAGTYLGLTLSTTDGYTISISGTATSSGSIATPNINLTDAIILPAGTYISKNGRLSLYKADGTWLSNQYSNVEFTINEPFYVRSVYFEITNGNTYNISTFIALAKGSTVPTAWTPYSNICPISGWTEANVTRTGKNLLAKPFDYLANIPKTLENFFFIKAGTYQFSFDTITATSWRIGILMKDADGNNLSDNKYRPYIWMSWNAGNQCWIEGGNGTNKSLQITIAEDCYIRLAFGIGDTTSSTVATGAQLELGSTATSYEPYTGNQISVTFPSSAGTVYGANVTVNPDRTGTLVVDRVYMGLTSALVAGVTDDGMETMMFRILANGVAPNQRSNIVPICSHYKSVAWSAQPWYIDLGISLENQVYIRIKDMRFSTLQEFKDYVDTQDIQIVYPLYTPITYQLTTHQVTTLLGSNNIWSDTGDIDVDYCADTKLYIEQLTQPSEDDMTANANIAANKFFMIGNTLYYSITSITAGEEIIVGTNANIVSLADALNTINS